MIKYLLGLCLKMRGTSEEAGCAMAKFEELRYIATSSKSGKQILRMNNLFTVEMSDNSKYTCDASCASALIDGKKIYWMSSYALSRSKSCRRKYSSSKIRKLSQKWMTQNPL